ncbi:DASS family sodium-coupled anion symporter [Methanospirillum hungatei]|uniref:SLC13 family permease n=1 Tax=Methanospirillum hungatei TaxID=2203 RepID=UPI0026EBF9A2|nr:DASS family sodium-coupled anion symporter [Methanospirillum hungatei]MCA1915225.1 DASS family sodium-coupled anion symporter [Methanospirillum hungatei]
MKNFFCVLLGLVVGGLILAMPGDLFISWEIQATAAVTTLMVIWWITEAIPIPATALVPLVGFPLLGVLTPAEASAPYADKTIFLFLGGFMIAAAMQKWNLHRRIALTIILLTGTSPKQIILGFMIATAFISLWISNTATAMMMIPIAVAIIGTVGMDAFKEKGEDEGVSDFAKALVISIAYAASIGGLGTIIGSPPNGIFLAQLKTLFPDAPTIGFVDWMLFGIPLVAIFIPLTWFWLVYGPFRHLPAKLPQSREIITEELKKLGRITTGERWTLIVFVMTALMWIFSATKKIGDITIPGLDILFPGIDDSTIAMFGAILLFILPVSIKNREYTMDWESAARIPWGILLLFGGGICLSKGFIKSGLADELVKHLTGLSILNVLVIIFLVAVLVSFLTEVTSNTAIASVMMPILAVTSVSLMINPIILMLTAALTASLAFMLPVATPPNAVAYGTGYLEMRDMMRTGFILNMIGVVLVTLFMYTVVLWALGITFELPSWAVTP